MPLDPIGRSILEQRVAVGAALVGERRDRVHAIVVVAVQAVEGAVDAVRGAAAERLGDEPLLAGGLDAPTSGQVFVEGEPIGTLKGDGLARLRRRRVGFVFQDFNLIPSLTAVENVALPLELDGQRVGKKARG